MAETTDKPEVIGYDPRRYARSLYWRGWGVTEIADELGLKRPTVESWKQRDKWDDAPLIQRLEVHYEMRLQTLIAKDKKTGGDIKEIDLLMRQVERTARIHKYLDGGNQVDLNPNLANRNAGEKKAPKRGNYFTRENVEALRAALEAEAYPHQHDWLNSSALRTRIILKSRQIGATMHFARERLVLALETGNNQIFLSASKAQALHFRQYIIEFAFKHTQVRLTGDPVVIEVEDGDPVSLYFLGTNYRTAQGYHGDFIFDEFFWVHGFEQIQNVASAIALQKRYTKTFFSTPSSESHEGYAFWTGEWFNQGRPRNEQVDIDVSHKALKGGRLCEDGIWRQIVTIEDAIGRGFDLVDLDQLRREYSADRYANLLMCSFLDDREAVFPLAEILRHTVDAFEKWKDFDHYKALDGRSRPFGDKPVWLSYDPTDTGDSAGLVVLAPPEKPGGKFRVLQRFQFWGADFDEQAEKIRRLCLVYNVTRIRIDATGVGRAVLKLVEAFFPTVEGLQYTAELKIDMVHKALDTFRRGRIEIDAGATDLFAALVTIRRAMTESGRNVTYETPRSKKTGHGDLGWALLQGLHIEPLNAPLLATTGAARAQMETC